MRANAKSSLPLTLLICVAVAFTVNATVPQGTRWQSLKDQTNQVLQNRPSSPCGRSSPSVVVDDEMNRIILFGGADHCTPIGNTYSDTWGFDLSANTWSEIIATENAPHRWGAYAWMVSSDLWVYGGNDHRNNTYTAATASAWKLDLSSSSPSWTQMAQGPPGSELLGNNPAVTMEDGSIIWMSFSENGTMSMWSFSTETLQFESLPTGGEEVPTIGWFTATLIDDSILYYGVQKDTEITVFLEYDLSTGSFSSLPLTPKDSTPPPLYGHFAWPYEGTMLIGGALQLENDVAFAVYQYDVSSAQWRFLGIGSCILRLYSQAAFDSNGNFFVVGGHTFSSADAQGCLNDVWQFSLV